MNGNKAVAMARDIEKSFEDGTYLLPLTQEPKNGNCHQKFIELTQQATPEWKEQNYETND